MLETSFMLMLMLQAHKILVTSPEAKFIFPFLGPGLWTGTWPGLVNYCRTMHTGGVEGWKKSKYEYRDQLEVRRETICYSL